MNQIIWKNKRILSEGKSFFQPFFNDRGIVKVGDLFSKDRIFLQNNKIVNASLPPCFSFVLMSIVNAIPSKWCSLIKANSYCAPLPLERTLFQITVAGKLVDLLDVTSKKVYNELRSHKQTPPTAKAKLMSRYPDLSIEWKRLYSLAFEITLDTKLREFQYKLLNLIIFTNKKLYQFKMVETPLCAFCNEEEESLEHLLYFCKPSSLAC